MADAASLITLLAQRGESVAVAESLTGGLLAAAFVEVPGASQVFRGGLLVYATDLKAELAGVDVDLLAAKGPVDPEVAAALAFGARTRCHADWGLATTGVAGPDMQDGIPPGTVYIGVSGRVNHVVELHLTGSRRTIRDSTVEAALDLLENVI